MRIVRPLLAATALTAILLSGCSSAEKDATVAAPSGQPAADPAASPAAPSRPTSPTTPTTRNPPPAPNPTDGARAVSTAREFLARELGMTEMVAGTFQSTGARTGEVGFRHKFGEGRRLLF